MKRFQSNWSQAPPKGNSLTTLEPVCGNKVNGTISGQTR